MKYLDLMGYDGGMIHISKIAMGSTMSMERLSTQEKHRLYDVYAEMGGNCLDTARAYSGGRAEAMIGTYLKERGSRDRFVICTKGGQSEKDESKGDLRREVLMRELETSLKELGTDYVDLYWLHKDDPDHPIEDVIETCNEMLRQGKVRRIGASNFADERIDQGNRYAREHGLTGFQESQIQWSAARSNEEVFSRFGSVVMTPQRYRFYSENQIPVFAFSSQAQGFYARLDALGLDALPQSLKEQYGSEDNLERYKRFKAFAEERGYTLPAVCLAYLINNALSCVPIIGSESEEMLRSSLEAADVEMTAQEADELYDISEVSPASVGGG